MTLADCFILTHPWGPAECDLSRVVEVDRRPLLATPITVSEVSLPEAGESLPKVGEHQHDGRAWQLWELPASKRVAPQALQQHQPPAESTVTLIVKASDTSHRLTLPLHDPVHPPSIVLTDDEDEEGVASSDQSLEAGSFVETLIGTHAEVMAEACDREVITNAAGWDGRVADGVLRDRQWLLEHWMGAFKTDEPRYALIVRLAQPDKLGRLLPEICAHPRVILQRDRQMRHVSRVEQLDPACLRWVSRQPGATIAQKAGSRQQVMSVVRVEQADTHENRVAKDLVRRCIRACLSYEREHRRFQNHERVRIVRRFRRTLQPLLRQGPLMEVGDLAAPPRPNYVLQFDSRYSQLWKAYQQLLRQERIRDSAWRWRHRLWTENIRLLVMAAMDDLSSEQRRWRSDLLLSEEHVQGYFLDPQASIPAVDLGNGQRIESVPVDDSTTVYATAIAELVPAHPDMVLVRRTDLGELRGVVGVWSKLNFNDGQEAAAALSRRLDTISLGVPLQAMLLTPAAVSAATKVSEHLHRMELPIPPQEGLAVLREVIREVV